MRHSFRVMLGLGLALGAAGCSDYLSGPGIVRAWTPTTSSPSPSPARCTSGFRQAQPVQLEGQIARDVALYMQQVAGDRPAADRASTVPERAFRRGYVLRRGLRREQPDHRWRRAARHPQDAAARPEGERFPVHRSRQSLRGAGHRDSPPTCGATSRTARPPTPRSCSRNSIRSSRSTRTCRPSSTRRSTSSSPRRVPRTPAASDGSEVIYAGLTADQLRAVYTQVAHSLKARLYMHVAATDASAYAKALAEAQLGISTPANDFLWFHDATPSGNNIWWQFNVDAVRRHRARRGGHRDPEAADRCRRRGQRPHQVPVHADQRSLPANGLLRLSSRRRRRTCRRPGAFTTATAPPVASTRRSTRSSTARRRRETSGSRRSPTPRRS